MPYLISSHPGCTLSDAAELAQWLNRQGHMPEQVQDFYPTPGTLATCMWYTGLDPRTMQPVFVPKTPHDKALQRALMQWRKPQNRRLVLEALHATGREDLIGYGKKCLVRPDKGSAPPPAEGQPAHPTKSTGKAPAKGGQPGALGGGKPAKGAGKPLAQRAAKAPGGAKGGQRTPPSERFDGKHAVEKSAARPKRKAGWAKPKKK